MSAHTLPVSMLGWSNLQKPGRATSEVRSFKAPRYRAALMLLSTLALGAMTAYAAFASPYTVLAERTLEAERIQNLSHTWLMSQPPERIWQPVMELMLPVTTSSVLPPMAGPDA